MRFIFLQAPTDSTGNFVTDLSKIEEGGSVFSIISSGGLLTWIILIPLFLMSIYAVFVVVERYMTLKKAAADEKLFMSKIKDYVHDGKLDSALTLCEQTDHPIARMIEKGLKRIGKPVEDISSAIENVGKLEVYKLENKLSALASISGAAPMIGFLGTVLGMVKTFNDIQKEADSSGLNISSLSEGMMTAMVTTVGGLIVGIIAYMSYNYLIARVNKVVQKMEASSIEFIDILEQPGK